MDQMKESDNSEFNGYGNAVSHNVNTSRGYDYIYDYNSVYTGDTSSFLPVDSCDIVDVPEGMDLQTAIADDNASTYELAMLFSPIKTKLQSQINFLLMTVIVNMDHTCYYMTMITTGSSSDSEQQFIEDSQYKSSDDEDEEDSENQAADDNQDEELSLRRTLSLGRDESTSSLCDLAQPLSSVTPLPQVKPTDFIKGRTDVSKDAQQAVRPYPLKRNSSSGNFIFNSDSEEESSSDEEQRPMLVTNQLTNQDTSISNAKSNAVNIPTQKKIPLSKQPNASDSSQSFRIVNNTPSPAEVGSSDVAIEGYFSPRNDSIKSVVSGGGMMDQRDQPEIETLSKGFEGLPYR